MTKRQAKRSALVALLAAATLGLSLPAEAKYLEALLIEKAPIPEPRPGNLTAAAGNIDTQQTASTPPAIAPARTPTRDKAAKSKGTLIATAVSPSVKAISGTLVQGLDALSNKDINRARAIRFGLPAGSLDRKILAWAIALSGRSGVTSGEIYNISRDLADWPGQTAMRKNLERAIARETSDPNAIIRSFGELQPVSVEGAIALAKAHLARNNRVAANKAIAPIWRNETLDKGLERKILSAVGPALTKNDHRFRMHWLFYRERPTAANRVAKFAEQTSLARARTAVARKASNSASLLKKVAPASRRDTAYIFDQVKVARRAEKYRYAAKLLASAPKDPVKLVHPDEWWVERRIVSRGLLDQGDYKLAYQVAAGHSATGRAKRAEAEFHAGWYALRFLNNKRLAQKHFQNILAVSNRPISQARGYYWLARASSGGNARKYYQAAAKHSGTYYGQLAANKLGQRALRITKPKPSAADRARFEKRELVRAIKKLESTNHKWRADSIYRHLAKTLTSPGEVAILAARAEKRRSNTLALQIGKSANARGLGVDTVAWPIGAIPRSAKMNNAGRALAYSIARQESAFNPKAVSPANARGLLQLLPGTAKNVSRRLGLKYSKSRLTSDPGYNATLGAAYLSEQLNRFDNSYILTFSGYNAGPRRAREWVERYGNPAGKPIDEVVDWVERIPFTETRNYVQRVMENYQVYKARIGGVRTTIEQDLRFGRK